LPPTGSPAGQSTEAASAETRFTRGTGLLSQGVTSPLRADSACAADVVTAANRTDLMRSSVSRNNGSCKRRAAPQEGPTERERCPLEAVTIPTSPAPRPATPVGHDRSHREGTAGSEPLADRRALPLDAYTGHAGATAASVRDEQRTAVCRGAPRALAAAGASASKERLAERDPCTDVDGAAVAGMPEIGKLRDPGRPVRECWFRRSAGARRADRDMGRSHPPIGSRAGAIAS
jgi:hypothetical protein